LLDVLVLVLAVVEYTRDALHCQFGGPRRLLDMMVYATWSTAVRTIPSAREDKDFVKKLASRMA